MNDATVSYYVLADHTLGYVNAAAPHLFGVLAGSLDGHDWKNGPVRLDGTERLRPATRADFAVFRVVATGHMPNAEQPSYMERAQAVASQLPEFGRAIFRERAELMSVIDSEWRTFEKSGLTPEQAANAALLHVVPLPWCERCRCYHHSTSPHVGEVRS